MFKVDVDSLDAYFNFDPARKRDLEALDRTIQTSAPSLERHFHAGTPAGDAGMRMKMIGYGRFRYAIKSGKTTFWPVIGVALQKNYISVYFSVGRDGAPIVASYAGKLGAVRSADDNFSFAAFDDLNVAALSSLLAEAADLIRADPENPVRYRQGGQTKRRRRLSGSDRDRWAKRLNLR
jgi:hypothetical protein